MLKSRIPQPAALNDAQCGPQNMMKIIQQIPCSQKEISGIYQMEIIDLQANDALKTTFKENSHLEFYLCLPKNIQIYKSLL